MFLCWSPILSRFLRDAWANGIRDIPQSTMDALTAYSWPGNVRELQNLVERAVIRSNGWAASEPFTKICELSSEPCKCAVHTGRVHGFSARCDIANVGYLRLDYRRAPWSSQPVGIKTDHAFAKMKKLGISRPVSQNDRRSSYY